MRSRPAGVSIAFDGASAFDAALCPRASAGTLGRRGGDVKLRNDDAYEGIAAEYQYRIVGLLDAALKETNLPERERREVCENFTFALSMLHDQGEVRVEHVEYQPVLAFAADGALFLPNDEFELHEYAFGNVSEHFAPEK